MPVRIETDGADGPVLAIFDGELDGPALDAAIAELSGSAFPATGLLADFSTCRLDLTAAAFMGTIDTWFDRIGPRVRTGLVFDPAAQKDHAMLFETKAFLAGGQVRLFETHDAARRWLASWSEARS